MGDAGEALVDDQSRIQERIEERQQARQRPPARAVDPERVRSMESLRLARVELQRQLELTTHVARREQIGQAVAELDRRLAELGA